MRTQVLDTYDASREMQRRLPEEQLLKVAWNIAATVPEERRHLIGAILAQSLAEAYKPEGVP